MGLYYQGSWVIFSPTKFHMLEAIRVIVKICCSRTLYSQTVSFQTRESCDPEYFRERERCLESHCQGPYLDIPPPPTPAHSSPTKGCFKQTKLQAATKSTILASGKNLNIVEHWTFIIVLNPTIILNIYISTHKNVFPTAALNMCVYISFFVFFWSSNTDLFHELEATRFLALRAAMCSSRTWNTPSEKPSARLQSYENTF